MMGHSAAVLFALAMTAAARDTDVTRFAHEQWAAGQKFEIQTLDRVYRGRLLDRSTGECEVTISSDGEAFTPPRTVYLLGATQGPQDRQMLVVMREVRVGQKMELGFDDLQQKHRQLTSEVRAIRLER